MKVGETVHLILSSCDFSGEASRQVILDHLGMPLSQCRVLFIPNEKATSAKIRSGKYHERLQNYGFSRENITVFDPAYADMFRNLDLDAVYVSGGNTFLTLQKLRACGVDRDLVRYLRAGVTYIGGSAGAHLVTRDLTHVAAYDTPPADMTDLRGLGLFDGILICHYTAERRAHANQLIAEGKYTVYTLTDEDSLVIGKPKQRGE